MWVLDTLYSLLENWLRDHTSWVLSGIGVKIKSFIKCFSSSVLNFTASRYTLLFSYSEIYIGHIINCKWSRSINFPLRIFCMRYKPCFSNNWYQSGLHFRICITCFVSFGIRDSNFMMLEDSTINFLHVCWNYYFIKTDIDVMMLFKFDIKYVKLNFKAIASMEFSFDLKLNLLYHLIVVCSWKTVENCLVNILENLVSWVLTD